MSRALTFVSETLRLSFPYVACALGAVVTERAGIVNVAFEGTLIVSGLAAATAAIATGSATVGVLAAIATGAIFCALHGFFVVRAGIDAIVSGIALNIAAYGAARMALRLLYDSAANSPAIAGFGEVTALGSIGRVLFEPAAVLVIIAAIVVPFVLAKTRFGLRVRAVGEAPEAARALGVPVAKTQLLATAFSGALGALGGAHLVFDQHHFDAGMSGGRGFIALAAAIAAGMRAGPATVACLFLAALEALQIALQDVLPVPTEIVQSLPYIAVLVVLSAAGRRKLRAS